MQSNYRDAGCTDHRLGVETARVHMNGRVYDPSIGRMISADPTIPNPMYSQAFNRYTYVYNNPTNSTDPSGFCPANGGDPLNLSDCQTFGTSFCVGSGDCSTGFIPTKPGSTNTTGNGGSSPTHDQIPTLPTPGASPGPIVLPNPNEPGSTFVGLTNPVCACNVNGNNQVGNLINSTDGANVVTYISGFTGDGGGPLHGYCGFLGDCLGFNLQKESNDSVRTERADGLGTAALDSIGPVVTVAGIESSVLEFGLPQVRNLSNSSLIALGEKTGPWFGAAAFGLDSRILATDFENPNSGVLTVMHDALNVEMDGVGFAGRTGFLVSGAYSILNIVFGLTIQGSNLADEVQGYNSFQQTQGGGLMQQSTQGSGGFMWGNPGP